MKITKNRTQEYALMFKALGDPTRLRIFEFLHTQCGPVAVAETGDVHPVCGPTVGEVCCRITGEDRISSTISHHLKELRIAGLIDMERRGKNMICTVNPDAVAEILAFLNGTAPTADVIDCAEGEPS